MNPNSTESGFSEIATKAEQQGLPWIARLANGFHRAASISAGEHGVVVEKLPWQHHPLRGDR